jgi:histidinol-phosphate/aromatic aminotransferase/cobyric acid decarboxylase-like protein
MTDWRSIVVPELAELDQFALGPTIAEVKELYGLDEVVKLSWNENLFGPLPGVLEAVTAELENIWLYPEERARRTSFRHTGASPCSGTSRACSCGRARMSSCRP